LKRLAAVLPVTVVVGNHDYINPDQPFFEFLGELDNVTYIKNETVLNIGGCDVWVIPHQANYRKWCMNAESKDAPLVVMHQPFMGAYANGHKLKDGFTAGTVVKRAPNATIVSGDIHMPQKVKIFGHRHNEHKNNSKRINPDQGVIHYVGSPYPVHFGDTFQPRVLIYNTSDKTLKSVTRATIRKWQIIINDAQDLDDYDLQPEDQAQVTIKIQRNEYDLWDVLVAAVRRRAEKQGWVLVSVDMQQILATNKAMSTISRVVSAKRLVQDFARSEKLGIEYVVSARRVMRSVGLVD